MSRNPFGSQVDFFKREDLKDENEKRVAIPSDLRSISFKINVEKLITKALVAIPSDLRSISLCYQNKAHRSPERAGRNPFGSQVDFFTALMTQKLTGVVSSRNPFGSQVDFF